MNTKVALIAAALFLLTKVPVIRGRKGAQSANPIDPGEPSVPADPADPVGSTDPVDQADPDNPLGLRHYIPTFSRVGTRDADSGEDSFIYWGYNTPNAQSRPYMATLQWYATSETKSRYHAEMLWDQWACNTTWVQGGPGWFHFCGGALIAPDMVLTAAHCVVWYNASMDDQDWQTPYESWRVGLGWWDLSLGENGAGHQVRGIKNITVHPEWLGALPGSVKQADVAVIQLDSDVDVRRNRVWPVKLTRRPWWDRTDGACDVSGWGMTQCGIANILQHAPMYTLSRQECQKQFDLQSSFLNIELNTNYRVNIWNTEICTLSWRWPFDMTPCNGDSGGMLVCGGKATGIVSWGESGCQGCRPSVYGRVNYARTWIKETMRAMRNA